MAAILIKNFKKHVKFAVNKVRIVERHIELIMKFKFCPPELLRFLKFSVLQSETLRKFVQNNI